MAYISDTFVALHPGPNTLVVLHPRSNTLVVLHPGFNMLMALHPGLNELSKHLEDSLARTHTLPLEDGWGNAAKLELEVILLPIPHPLLEIHSLRVRSKRLGFDGHIVQV